MPACLVATSLGVRIDCGRIPAHPVRRACRAGPERRATCCVKGVCMARHCLLLSVATAIVVLIGVELAMRAPGQGNAVALVAAVAAGVAVQLGLALFVVRPLRDQEALLRERLRLAEQGGTRLAELEASTSSLRHDLRGILSPSLMMADRLLNHADPKVRRVGEVVVQTVERCNARLGQTRGKPPAGES